MAVKIREKRGEPVDGQWLRAQKYTDAYHKYAIKLQNRDGSFSTSWLKKRDASGDTRSSYPNDRAHSRMARFLIARGGIDRSPHRQCRELPDSTMLNRYRQREWEIGHAGHALRALALYNERVFGDKPGERRALLARRPKP